ncbi:hypothetical protein SPHV1_2230059 [Novosphingobium sp. KN65.2]|nr:hypothetical protein SPHV1_2230059 [Novosphingobium sp. KN65.2]
MHAERFEDPAIHELRPVFAGNFFDHEAKHDVSGIAETPAGSGRRIDVLRGNDVEQLCIGILCPKIAIRRGWQARSVIEQLAHGYLGPLGGHSRQVALHRRVQFDLAVFHQQHDGCRGQLHAGGADLEHRIGMNRHAMLYIGLSEGLHPRQTTFVDNRDGDAGRLAALHLRRDQIIDRVSMSRSGKKRGKKKTEAHGVTDIHKRNLPFTRAHRNC